MRPIEKFFTENAPDSDLVIEKVIEFGIDFLGGEWKNVKKNEVKVTTILGGQSNHMFHVTSSTSATPYLLRIHRQGPSHVFMDTVNFAIFSERGLGPKLYGFFDGGRMEEFLPSRTLDSDCILDPEISRRVGAVYPKYHAIDVPVSKKRRCFQVMRESLKEYQDLGGGDYEIKPTTVTYSEHPKKISMDDLYKEIDFMEKWTNELFEDTVVFCHNDLASSNILELNSTKELVLIDWEFGSYNCRGFDLAMHLAETAADFRDSTPPGIRISEELTDNPPNLQGFCEAYVDADNKLKNRVPSNRDLEVSNLICECQFFWPITQLFWACFVMKLALLKYNCGVDMDVQAQDRFAVYWHLKERTRKIYEDLKKGTC
ncbi:Choline kinase B1 [Caenorhabditis elegans]|uniref:Choline kinase B1 n=1 Tax=Caenorhabditis elegans TaxID=6239 RepID=CKB1_CAEEL|nr:Choline kinase B1 [Caenorhabditis elegans]P46558.2 RecName: Full=Choline kinase B1 [Caenorhabditis elegans]AAN41642.1 choline kinase CKB-1 [Caenorhabditis elegans]CAA84300.2 Choline kinase B1 [Caenorhabditis elegans]|eukprot:NP_497879.2 Choline kinase B1 [Caenorhabditis elegans]